MTVSHRKKIEAATSASERGSRDRRIARAVQSGVPMAQIARQVGMDVKTIARICGEQGVKAAKGRPA
jgi:DNA-binding NarL/FixJ family response regulator